MLLGTVATFFSALALTTALPSDVSGLDLEQRQTSSNNWPIDCSDNGGTALCCQGTFAGDLPLIVALAGLTDFPLNPNDVNCIGTSPASESCVGVNTCCQVTATNPLIALYCQKPANC